MAVWKALLLVYVELDVRLPRGRRRRFHHFASDAERADAITSFRAFPNLAAGLTSGAARVEPTMMESPEPLGSKVKRGNTLPHRGHIR